MRFLRRQVRDLAVTYESGGGAQAMGNLTELFFIVAIKSGSSGKRLGRPRTKFSIFRMATVASMFRRWQFP
jgi:hypothetical protein